MALTRRDAAPDAPVWSGSRSDSEAPLDTDFAMEVWHRRKWLALAVFVVALAGAATLVLSLPNLYRASATVLVERQQITQKQAELTIETIFESMKTALCGGENIEIRGLGAFHVKNYQGYQGRNPKTGQIIPVKPKRGLLFRTGKELRDRVNRPAPQTPQFDISFDPKSGSGTNY